MHEGLLKFYVLRLFGVELLDLFFWYALHDERLCFLLATCVFWGKTAILIIPGFFSSIKSGC